MGKLSKVRWRRVQGGRRSSCFAKTMVIMVCFTFTLSGIPGLALAQVASLKDVPIPQPDLTEYIKDYDAALALGKALFWDMQVGSDGVQACASCHFHAGADNRSKNQLNPNTLGGDTVFGNSAIPGIPSVPGHPKFGPNYNAKAGDFPLHDREPSSQGVPRPSAPGLEFFTVTRDTNDVFSSQGVRLAKFKGVKSGKAVDQSTALKDPVFTLKKKNIRRVEPRNTPTVINAVFNVDNFWEGRASTIFNGVNVFGFRDRTSTLKKNVGGVLTDVFVRIPLSSLASQAVGPPLSDFEMSFQGRDFPSVGRKMLSLRPLAKQLVHPEDSVLGCLSRAHLIFGEVVGKKGLSAKNYAVVVKAAFKDEWWNSTEVVNLIAGTQAVQQPSAQNPRTMVVSPGKTVVTKAAQAVDSPETLAASLGASQFTQMEYNFSLFFGLAVQIYEATLVSDDTPLDRYLGANLNVRGGGVPIPPDPNALTPQELLGLDIFRGTNISGQNQNPTSAPGCQLCHTLPETTEFTVRNLQVDSQGVPQNLVKWIPDGNGGLIAFPPGPPETAYIDFGMRNLAHRPNTEDIGRIATAPDLPPFQNPLEGNKPLPLSYVELWKLKTAGKLPADVASFVPNIATPVFPTPPPVNDKTALKGCFKVSNLRNCVFHGPYFHDGGYSTLGQAVQFYIRGGNFPNINFNEHALGIVPLTELDPSDPLKTPAEKALAFERTEALVAFLANALTDDRVKYRRAPFDDPQLLVPNGAKNNNPQKDIFIEIPPVGANGAKKPLDTFLKLD
ncbi:MAG: cytochrome c peroxidase, partial [Syntrophales bacterium]|nr:cytochrome c peroxidase [Syntrophales bacterium]